MRFTAESAEHAEKKYEISANSPEGHRDDVRSPRLILTREIMHLYITGFTGSGHQAQA